MGVIVFCDWSFVTGAVPITGMDDLTDSGEGGI